MLEAQCGAWGSIISAAVHVPLVGGKVVSGEPSGSELLDTGGGRRLLNVAVCILCSLPAHHLAKVLGSLLAGMVLLPPLATSCCVLTKYDVPSPPTRAESVALHGQDVAVPMALISEFHKRVQARGRCGAVRGRPAALTRAVCLLVETAPATAVAATPVLPLPHLPPPPAPECPPPPPAPLPLCPTRRCKLDIVFLSEEVASLEYVGLYPVNALRNKALQMATTEVRSVCVGAVCVWGVRCVS